MKTCRHRILASLALAAIALFVVAGALLSRPPTAAAAAVRPDQTFRFGPVTAKGGQAVSLTFYNSANRPTPPSVFTLRLAGTGQIVTQSNIVSIPPASGGQAGWLLTGSATVVAQLEFNRTLQTQTIPDPLAVTMQVLDPDPLLVHAVLTPAE